MATGKGVIQGYRAWRPSIADIRSSSKRGGTGIVPAVKNTSTTTFYAKLGDASNSSLDQPDVFAVEGSTGFIERTGDGSN